MITKTFLTTILLCSFAAAATADDESFESCAKMLYDYGIATHDHLVPLDTLATAIAGRPLATVLIRHDFAAAKPKCYAPLTFVAGHHDLVSEHLFVQDQTDAYAVLHGTTPRLLETARELLERYDPKSLYARVLDEGFGEAQWRKGKTMVQLDDAREATWLSELAAMNVDSATIYDTDHNTGLFAYPRAAFGDDAAVRALGIDVVPTFDRPTFADSAKLWRADEYAVVSRPAYDRLAAIDRARAAEPALVVPPELRAAIARCFGTVCDPRVIAASVAAPVVVVTPPPIIAPVAVTAPSPTVAVAADPEWITALGPDAKGRAIILAIIAHDPSSPGPHAKLHNTPGYAPKRFAELWARHRPGQDIGETDLRRSDASGAYFGINRRAGVEVEKQWRRFVLAGPAYATAAPVAAQEPEADAEPTNQAPTEAPAAPVPAAAPATAAAPARILPEALDAARAFLTRAASSLDPRPTSNLKDVFTRLLLAVELEIPDALLTHALLVIDALPPGSDFSSTELRVAWGALEHALALPADGDVTLADVEKLVRSYDRSTLDQRTRFLKQLDQRPALTATLTALSDGMRLRLTQNQINQMMNAWSGWSLGGKDKTVWTILYRRPGVLEPDADFVIPYIAVIDNNKVTRFEDGAPGLRKFYVTVSYQAGLRDLNLEARFTPGPTQIKRDVQLELLLERNLDLSLIARVLRRGELVAARGTLDFVLRDPSDGRTYEVGFLQDAHSVYQLTTFKAQR